MSPIKIAHVATGNVGRIALRQVIEDPRFELVALVVSDDAKVGKDAGELAGAAVETGIRAVQGIEAAIAASPDVVVYCAMGEVRPREAVADVVACLKAGIDVAATAPVPLLYPWGSMPDRVIERVQAACVEGGSSLFVNGVDPGWATDLLPLAVATTCQRVEQVRCLEIADYATYDGADVMHFVMGFGTPVGEVPMLFQPGVLTSAWGPALYGLADAFGVTLDEISESFEQEPAPESFEVAVGTIAEGTVAAVRFQITGMVDGHPAFVVDHTTRLRPDLRPDWPQPAQPGGSYRIEITGEPSYALDLCLGSTRGDHNHAGPVATAMRVVNAIPAVVAAEPGLRTTLDLPLIAGVGRYAAP